MDALEKVLSIEVKREEQALQQWQLAQRHWQAQQQKLASLQSYRLEYLKKLQGGSQQGVAISTYQQLLSFMGTLDNACAQQSGVVTQAQRVSEQRRQQWVQQQTKRKAIEVLLQQRVEAAQVQARRVEQKQQDEWVSQRFMRNPK